MCGMELAAGDKTEAQRREGQGKFFFLNTVCHSGFVLKNVTSH